MTRRQFVLALALAIWAGPSTVIRLIERHQREQLIIRQLRYQGQMAINAMYRRMQRDLIGAFNWSPAEWDAFDV